MKPQDQLTPGTQNVSLFLVLFTGVLIASIYGVTVISQPVHTWLGGMLSELDQWIQNSTAFH